MTRKLCKSFKRVGLFVSFILFAPWIVSRLGVTHYWFGQEWMLCLSNGTLAFAWKVLGIGRSFAPETFTRWLPSFDLVGATKTFVVPLWIPLLFAILATAAFFWWYPRLIPAGHCQHCGYNLTGNVSGVCPECGEGINVS
ncbi:MAG: hypothetical protein ACYTBZ_14425 [Planctomycetota bacterium]